jgi:hypothetical protein
MADNLALKLLVAGIIGAVVGAAAAEKYHFPTGLVYGFSTRPTPYYGNNYGTRPPIGAEIGAGEAGEGRPGARVVLVPDWQDGPPPSAPRYRPQPHQPQRTTTLCWQPYENWNFAMSGRWVPCQPGRRSRGG